MTSQIRRGKGSTHKQWISSYPRTSARSTSCAKPSGASRSSRPRLRSYKRKWSNRVKSSWKRKRRNWRRNRSRSWCNPKWNYKCSNDKKLQEPFHSPVPPQVHVKAHNIVEVNPLCSRCTRWRNPIRRWMSSSRIISTTIPCQCPHQCYRILPRSLLILINSRWWMRLTKLIRMQTPTPPSSNSTRCRPSTRSTPAPSMPTLLTHSSTSSGSINPTHYRCRTILWRREASHSLPTYQQQSSMWKCTTKVLTSSPVARTKPTSISSSRRSRRCYHDTNREKRMPASCWRSDDQL